MLRKTRDTGKVLLAVAVLTLFCGCASTATGSVATTEPRQAYKSWSLGPFIKRDLVNPILEPSKDSKFWCPVRQESVRWEEKDVFNPSAVVKDNKVYLVYRAEDKVGCYVYDAKAKKGHFAGTSRIGLAVSEDGLNFKRESEPVLYPENDSLRNYEWEGGIEDPRVVEDEDGTYYMTYTAYDGCNVELMIASSRDLHNWKKHGPAHKQYADRNNIYLKSKAGAIVCRQAGDRHVAAKINGTYWMYWFNDVDKRGDLVRHMCCSTSKDLKNWDPVLEQDGTMRVVLKPRKGMFDSRLNEPGPHALVANKGIVLIYNGMNLPSNHPDRDENLKADTYSAGQALFALDDPSRLVDRTDHYFMTPDREYEIKGQINLVCFLEGLVHFKGEYFLYYGTADSKIAVAVWDTKDKEPHVSSGKSTDD